MLGFVCDAHSPRLIAPTDVRAIAARLPPHIGRVGVFGPVTDDRWCLADRGVFSLFHRIQYADDSLWTAIVRENWDMGRKIKAFPLTSDKDLR